MQYIDIYEEPPTMATHNVSLTFQLQLPRFENHFNNFF